MGNFSEFCQGTFEGQPSEPYIWHQFMAGLAVPSWLALKGSSMEKILITFFKYPALWNLLSKTSFSFFGDFFYLDIDSRQQSNNLDLFTLDK